MSDVKFQFVGSTAAATKKISWPVEVQAAVIRARLLEGASSKEAFEVGRIMLGVDELPQSYANKNAGSVFDGLLKRFQKRVNKGDQATIDAALEAGIIEPTE